ncbi:fungal Zn(2)-Cys(6) binuclear cluster domain containing protein [Acanthamoeba castellanii str. Neff]|uniref:Fungal Zn(2)-Cys(6) binuclear cluster domain containing protein n=1 Tax=Acanthamoeba castellanii (strain ATCC 30010 / Neff) TaxID=1257118 RepID=L8GPB9_ACACF|nr:fungal Zn(2)-Cys(6) binuclear cluster domain containing protein [Acanthamoeba castellanii str. Neff]ELR14747.1 fungal Zn(2)-Cys(6) binuclear cluster domain containing protein [Acanthamoeba castellanii str. Neff]
MDSSANYGMDRGDGRGGGTEDSMLGDPDSPDDLGSLDDDDEDEMGRDKNGQPKSKKRRKYINKACDNCRTRHSRCDGKEPCAPCSKKGFQCGYSAPPSRRGPVSERQLQELITSLTKQIESEKKMKKDWKDKFYHKAGGPSSPPSSTSGGGGAPFSPSSDGSGGAGGGGGGTMPSDSFNSPTSSAAAAYSGGLMAAGGREGGDMAGGYGGSTGAGWGGADQASNLAMYVDAYQRYISRHISAHPSVFEPGAALKVISSNQRTPLAFQMYAVLANGARVTGNQPASLEFALKARRTLGAVFDQTDGLVAQGLMILAYYMSGQAEADKTMYYLQLARKMCQHLDTRSSDYYMLILMTIGLASPHHEEKLEVFTELKMRLEPLLSNTITPATNPATSNLNRNFTLTLAIISVQVELEMAKLRMDYNADYAVMLQVLEKLEKMLAADKSSNYSKVGFRIFLEVIRAQCYCSLGLREMAVECTSEVSELAKHPEFPYVPVMVLSGVEMMAMIQLEEGRFDQVHEHIHRLSKMSAIYPSVRLIAQKLNDALQEKTAKSYDGRPGGPLDLGRPTDHGPVPGMGMSHLGGGVPSFGQSGGPAGASSTSPHFPGQDRTGHGGGGGLPSFMQGDMQRRQMPPDLPGSNGGGGGMGMHERGLPFPGSGGGGDPLGLGLGGVGGGGMGSRAGSGLEGLGGMDSRMMQERGYPPKPDHLTQGGYEGMGGRLGGLPPHLTSQGERGLSMEDLINRERAMGMGPGGPLSHHLGPSGGGGGYGQSQMEQQHHQQQQQQQQELDYRMQQERASMLERRALQHPQGGVGMPLGQQQQGQGGQSSGGLPPHLNPYASHGMHRSGMPGGPSSLYGGGGMPDMRGMPHPSQMGGSPSMGGRGLPGMPSFGGGGGPSMGGGSPFGGGGPMGQQMRGWPGMPGMPPYPGPLHNGGDSESGGPPRHHLPPPLHHQQQQYMMYGSAEQQQQQQQQQDD